jgi:hypothetical protein
MDDSEPEFTLAWVEPSGEPVEVPLTAAGAERFILIAHGLDPGSFLDPADDERDEP